MAKRTIQNYLERAKTAKTYEQQQHYVDAVRCWREAWKAAPTETQRNWSYARADFCFKCAVGQGAIKSKRGRQYDFLVFMGLRNE